MLSSGGGHVIYSIKGQELVHRPHVLLMAREAGDPPKSNLPRIPSYSIIDSVTRDHPEEW